jgi:CDP-glucose 4,6-dehydratase
MAPAPVSDATWYAGRRVLITGHTGFKGAWLAAWLSRGGADITGYGLLPPEGAPSLYGAAAVGDLLRSVVGDVRDGAAVARAMATARPEVVFHLAAQALVRRSYQDPVGTYETNVLGTAHVLSAAERTRSVRAVVVVTSDKCYENRERSRPYTEDEPLGGADPYSSSKACAELVTAAMRRSFLADTGCAVATARAGNVIGGGDWSDDRLVPDLMRAAAAGVPAQVRNPGAIRPWQFVLEPLRGYLVLGRRLVEDGASFAEAWNFGPAPEDPASSVRELVGALRRCWDRIQVVEAPDPAAPHEAATLRLDSTKAATRLGWRPVLDLASTAELTVAWYRRHAEDPGLGPGLVDEQLADYERRIEKPQKG